MAAQPVDRKPLDALGLKLISSDNHVNEPRDLFTSRFPAHLKDKAPRVVRGADGGDGWSFDGAPPKLLPAGSYFSLAGGVKHATAVEGDAPCVFFIEREGAFDAISAEPAPAPK